MAPGENTAMTITLEITPDLEEVLRETAAREGLAPDRYVLNLLRQQLMRNERTPPHLSREEAELLQKINRGLPEATWERYRALKLKRDDETLTPEEHAELIALTDAIEGWNVQRLEIVSRLAKLRGIQLPEMMKELGLLPPSHA
jgi:hypothetical protein